MNRKALLKTLRYVGINTVECLLYLVGIIIAGAAIITIMAKLAPVPIIILFVVFIATLLYTIYNDIRNKYREYKQEDEDINGNQ